MVYTIHPRLTTQDTLRRYVGYSVAGHALALILLTFTVGHTARLAPPAAVRVQLVGVPIPAVPKPKKPPEEVRTQDSAAPKEPPPEAKNMPPSDATTKLATPVSATIDVKESDIAAAERPPVLDKTPREKKVVKNTPDAKVVRNPEDFLNQLDFVDDLAKQATKPTPNAPPSTQKAGDGPTLSVNLNDDGTGNAIRDHINKYWEIPPGMDVRGLSVIAEIKLDNAGNLISSRIYQSSGIQALDRRLMSAISRAMPLPIPPEQLLNYQEILLSFSAGG